MALKWGFACAGKVAHDYLNAIGTLEEGHHEVVAIAEPMFVQQAENLAQKFNIPKCYTTFLELAQDPNVEVVHVGTLNPQHLEVSLLMLQHGKHVLCQKPLCMNEKQARQLIEYARQKKLFLTASISLLLLPGIFDDRFFLFFFSSFLPKTKRTAGGNMVPLLSKLSIHSK